VTHDLREAHLLADRLAVFDEGKLLQYGPRDDVFRRPVSPRVATLTGVSNLVEGRVLETKGGRVLVDCSGVRLWCGPQPDASTFEKGQRVVAALRAELVNFRRHDEFHEFNHLRATVAEDLSYGAVHTIRLQPEGPGPLLRAEIAARPHSVLGITPGSTWTIELPPEDLHVMAPDP
jgi:ABC-type Fe3+/spermidine/putrescine transport system ATPase subunit